MSIKQTVEEIYKTNTNYSEPEQVLNQVGSLKYLSADLYTDSKIGRASCRERVSSPV